MDPSLINNRTRRCSIVKEAPLALRDETAASHRPKWLTSHARRPETRHNRHIDVTQCYLYDQRDRFKWSILSEAPLRGAGASQGGL